MRSVEFVADNRGEEEKKSEKKDAYRRPTMFPPAGWGTIPDKARLEIPTANITDQKCFALPVYLRSSGVCSSPHPSSIHHQLIQFDTLLPAHCLAAIEIYNKRTRGTVESRQTFLAGWTFPIHHSPELVIVAAFANRAGVFPVWFLQEGLLYRWLKKKF